MNNLANAAYDSVAIEQWKLNTPMLSDFCDFRPLPRRYKSNWRILHIDGFEAKKVFFFAGYQKVENV